MKQCQNLTPEERARLVEIQDLLIDRFVEHKEAVEKGEKARAEQLELEIGDLRREKDNVMKWAVVGSA